MEQSPPAFTALSNNFAQAVPAKLQPESLAEVRALCALHAVRALQGRVGEGAARSAANFLVLVLRING